MMVHNELVRTLELEYTLIGDGTYLHILKLYKYSATYVHKNS